MAFIFFKTPSIKAVTSFNISTCIYQESRVTLVPFWNPKSSSWTGMEASIPCWTHSPKVSFPWDDFQNLSYQQKGFSGHAIFKQCMIQAELFTLSDCPAPGTKSSLWPQQERCSVICLILTNVAFGVLISIPQPATLSHQPKRQQVLLWSHHTLL